MIPIANVATVLTIAMGQLATIAPTGSLRLTRARSEREAMSSLANTFRRW